MKIRAGTFKKIYDPSVGEKKQWYINDHCIIKGKDGWHMFGITHEEPADPLNEVLCAHAFSEKLTSGWRKLDYPITADRSRNEQHFWAPHVIEHEGSYYMFWCAGNTSDHTKYQIVMAKSDDLFSWKRCDEVNPIVVDGFDARDPMVIRIGETFYLYYTCCKRPEGGHYQVACVESRDLFHWSNKRVVFEDTAAGTFGGPCESPFIVPVPEGYLLFIGPRSSYSDTAVFLSRDPFSFKLTDEIARIPSHAAEIVRDCDGQYYITRCGWGQGGLYLAPLYFED